MKIFCPALLMILLYTLTGCSSPSHLEKDKSINLPAAYKTYMWVETKANENDLSKKATVNADVSVHNTVNNQLDDWKWKPAVSNPDIYISYDVFVEGSNNGQSSAATSITRYYYDTEQQKWNPIIYPGSLNGYQLYEAPVDEGTFVITMTEAKTGKTIWQGWTTERLHSSGITNLDAVKSVRRIFRAD